MRRKSLDLIAIGLIIAVTLSTAVYNILVGVGGFSSWFLPVGVLMVLFIPGYVLTLAILPELDEATTLLLSLGISISMDILGGFVLNYTSWGLQPLTWALWLCTISLPGCIIALYRRRLLTSDVNTKPVFIPLTGYMVISFILTGVLVSAAIVIARYSALESGSHFTQLWTVPGADEEGYTVQVGIHNEESTSLTYNLYAESEAATIEQWTDITLAPGETWTATLSLTEKPDSPISFMLFKSGSPDDAYRTTRLVPATFDKIITPTAWR